MLQGIHTTSALLTSVDISSLGACKLKGDQAPSLITKLVLSIMTMELAYLFTPRITLILSGITANYQLFYLILSGITTSLPRITSYAPSGRLTSFGKSKEPFSHSP